MNENRQEGREPLVWIVDCEHWPRADLRAELIERGFDAVGFIRLEPVLAALQRTSSPRPRVLIVELRGQQFGAPELQKLAASNVPIVLLAGALEMQQPEIMQFEWAALMKRPVTLGQIADEVETIVGKQSGQEGMQPSHDRRR